MKIFLLTILLFLNISCRTMIVGATYPSGTKWHAYIFSCIWDTNIESLIIKDVGEVNNYKSKTDAKSLEQVNDTTNKLLIGGTLF